MAFTATPFTVYCRAVRNSRTQFVRVPIYLCPALIRYCSVRSLPRLFSPPKQLEHGKSFHAEPLNTQKANPAIVLQRLPIQCPGCGALAQTVLEEEAGFYSLKSKSMKEFIWGSPKEASEEESIVQETLKNLKEESITQQFKVRQLPEDLSESVPVCRRCHNLKHHQVGVSIKHPTIQSIQDTIYESPYKYNHVYHVLDAADFPMSLIPGLHKILHLTPQRSVNRRSKTGKFHSGKQTDVSFIITRADLLAPTKEQVDRLMPYLISVLRDALGRAGRDVRLGNVRCVSAKRGWWTPELKEDIWKRGGGGWMVGKVNVGKSQLFHEVFPKGRLNHGAVGKQLLKRSLEPPILTKIGEPSIVTPHDTVDSFSHEINIFAKKPSTEHEGLEHGTVTFSPQDFSAPELHSVSTIQSINENSLLPPLPPTSAYPPMPLISALPGTTASPIRIPFGSGKGELIDLPGLSRSNLETHIQPRHRQSLIMQSRIKPDQQAIKNGKSLLLGGCIRITPCNSTSSNEDDSVVLAYPFTPLTPHLTSTPKAIAVQSQVPGASPGVENISLPGTGENVRSAGIFKLKWDVTRERTGPITRKNAAGINPERLPYRVLATDLLIEGVGWVEIVVQVRKKRRDENHRQDEEVKRRGARGEKDSEEKDELEDVDIPAVEVFSPEGKFIGQRRPLNAWKLISEKPGGARLKARPRKAMKGAKKNSKAVKAQR